MTAPTPEMLVLVMLFAGIGYVQNEYLQPKHAIAYSSPLETSIGRADTFRVHIHPRESSYFCPPHCAVDHHHFVHLKGKCIKTKCTHMVIDTVTRYMKREEYIKRNDIKRGSPPGPIIRPAP